MALWFETIASSVSVVVGAISIVFTLSSLVSSLWATHHKLREAQKQRFQSVLESDNLIVVGSYLDEVIGNCNVYEYVSNRNVSKTVDSYLEKLRFFVGADTEVEQQIRETKTPPKIKVPSSVSDEFDKVLTELRSGEVWNALARLRRHIEITLRGIAKAKDIQLGRSPSAGYLLNALFRSGLISKDVFSNLKYAITVCNKAIHGLEVNWSEAEEATLHASIALGKLR